MNIIYEPDSIILDPAEHFSISRTFCCGQCFRFMCGEDGVWSGIAFGRTLRCRQDGNTVTLFCSAEEFRNIWYGYFDLGLDYGKVNAAISADPVAAAAAEYADGIRILRQDPWETLVSFIISQNNNIPRIRKIISALCALLGDRLPDGGYAFPTAESIARAGAEALAPIRAGFRAGYIYDAAVRVSTGVTDLEAIAGLDRDTAEQELMKIRGVGKKVAACVLLYGFGFLSAFPIDVWVKRIIDKYYGGSLDPTVFGEYAGIAQQYLFHYERCAAGASEDGCIGKNQAKTLPV